jgi:FkbM family methyltransferase
MIKLIKWILGKPYRLIRYSSVYPLYLKFFRSSIYRSYQIERKFYEKLLLGRSAIVFDIGANVGDKSVLFSKFSQRVIAVDPDQHNYKLLKRRLFFQSKVVVINAAVGRETGKGFFYVNSPGSPSNTMSVKWKKILEDAKANRWSTSTSFSETYEVDIVTLDTLVGKYGMPTYIKIDVEGYENHVLEGLTKAIPIISFEANFPDFRDETIQCVHKISRLSSSVDFNIIDDRFEFFWDEHKDYRFIVDWLAMTELKYFEVFCFCKAVS